MALVLPLRAFPWLKTVPVYLRRVKQKIVSAVEREIPFELGEEESYTGVEILPTSGFTYTDVTLKSNVDVSFSTPYGYDSTPIAEIDLDSIPCSTRLGAALSAPGYLMAVIVWEAYFLRPEETIAFANQLPADDVLVVGLLFSDSPIPLPRNYSRWSACQRRHWLWASSVYSYRPW